MIGDLRALQLVDWLSGRCWPSQAGQDVRTCSLALATPRGNGWVGLIILRYRSGFPASGTFLNTPSIGSPFGLRRG